MLLAQPVAAAPEKTFKGIWRFGSEEESFSPCGFRDVAWWVLASEENWNALRAASGKHNATLEEGIFVELRGFYDGPATKERSGVFSTKFDGIFKVTKFISARPRTNKDCR